MTIATAIHDLRHTAATCHLGMGTHPKVVQEMLGHSSITLTLDTYSHYIPTLHREAARQMDRLFDAGQSTEDGSGETGGKKTMPA